MSCRRNVLPIECCVEIVMKHGIFVKDDLEAIYEYFHQMVEFTEKQKSRRMQ